MVCPYSLAVWGGVQAQVLGLARTLRRSGLDVQVLAPCDGQPPERWVTPLGNSIPYAENGSFAPIAPDLPAQLRTLASIWDEGFDVLHLHEPLVPGPTLTSVVVKPAPLLGTFHANGRLTAYKWGKPILRRLGNRLDLRVAVSADAAGTARSGVGGSYDILFNGIEFDLFDSARRVHTNGPTVFFLSRHEPRKGLGVLLDAVQYLPPEVHIWVGGSGAQTDELRSTYPDDRIEWLGPISDSEKAARLHSADVFCVPSLGGESFGVVLLEAMAAEVPVVASDLAAYRAVTGGGQTASLFPTGDAKALAKALCVSLEGGAEVSTRIGWGRKRAEEFSMGRLAELYRQRYERLAA